MTHKYLLIIAIFFGVGLLPKQACAFDDDESSGYEESADDTLYQDEEEEAVYETEEEESYPILHAIVMYPPNRLFDLLDVVRLRARVGPGIAAGVRVTTYAEAYLGSYMSIYAGLPGPRGRQLPKSPIGLEVNNAAALGPFGVSADFGMGPDYGESEIGVSLHAVLVGVDAGFDPVEILDFFTGIFFIDIADDDF
ncbi:MAG: hypothetical protein PHC51_11780 [bacterium]|nr:hypothetical protein [bacterium]